jgi:hypothetical protein
MSTKKPPETPRRVWRMTAEAPAGEYLDLALVPKEAAVTPGADAASQRVAPPEASPSAHGKAAMPADLASHAAGKLAAAPTERPSTSVGPPARAPSAEEARSRPPARARVLRPAQVESWQASSFDLLTGCVVRDVTDTIPGKIFDELFSPGEPDPDPRGPVRRRR